MPLVLLDRDGVINQDSMNYIRAPDQWRALPGSLAAIARLKRAGFAVAVCTNQSGIGRGLFSEQTLHAIHTRMTQAVAEHGVLLDGVYYCPHAPTANCTCRKPKPGLLQSAMTELGFAANDTTMVGDDLRDLQAAHAAGCRAMLIAPHGASADAQRLCDGRIFVDLAAAVDALLAQC
jgi:D-glycero-D-manno-heptose 1,7-bisphosphate phosphatase